MSCSVTPDLTEPEVNPPQMDRKRSDLEEAGIEHGAKWRKQLVSKAKKTQTQLLKEEWVTYSDLGPEGALSEDMMDASRPSMGFIGVSPAHIDDMTWFGKKPIGEQM